MNIVLLTKALRGVHIHCPYQNVFVEQCSRTWKLHVKFYKEVALHKWASFYGHAFTDNCSDGAWGDNLQYLRSETSNVCV